MWLSQPRRDWDFLAIFSVPATCLAEADWNIISVTEICHLRMKISIIIYPAYIYIYPAYPKWMVYNGNFRRGTLILGNPHPSIHPSIHIYIYTFYVYIYIYMCVIIFWPQDICIYIYIYYTHHPDYIYIYILYIYIYIYVYVWNAYAVIRQIDTAKTRHNSKIFSWGKSHSSRLYATKKNTTVPI